MESEYPFIETIRVIDGRFCLLDYHLERMSRTCREVYGADAPQFDAAPDAVPRDIREGVVKCRISYGREIGRIEFMPYSVRNVESLRLVRADDIDYHLKYACRNVLEALRAMRGKADEILIVKDGFITDTTYSNIVCISGPRLLTPRRPLLRGVMREWLLDTGKVEEADITPEMLKEGNGSGITAVGMINAMMPLGEGPVIQLRHISGLSD